MYKNLEELKVEMEKAAHPMESGEWEITDFPKFKSEIVDRLVYNFVFNPDQLIKTEIVKILRTASKSRRIVPCSIQPFYEAMGRREVSGLTVPAINVRGLTYDVARAVFRAAIKNDVGAFIFELARSEMGYTGQSPLEYSTVILAAGLKENYSGPLFIQGDHFQVKSQSYRYNPEEEKEAINKLIKDSIEAQFYNIDIDTSTLVDLSRPSIPEQQRLNYELCARFTSIIRNLEPRELTISVGGEIGEVGGKNSTPEELRAYMDGYLKSLSEYGGNLKGLSKVSVQTGTTHGGIPLPDGTIARVKIDFNTLKEISRVARIEYGMSGAVQHGASTLPDEAFHKFVEVGTAEIHLATGFQNMIFDHPLFPEELKEEIYSFLTEKFGDERKPGETDEQFLYKTRKKAFGPFKRELWKIEEEIRNQMAADLERKFDFLFKQLNVTDTKEIVNSHVTING